jgi:transposase-like protein
VTVYRWVRRFTPLLADAARPCRHAVGERWHVDETYLKVRGSWRYLYRAIDQFGQVIGVFLSAQRDAPAARRFFTKPIATTQSEPAEVVTDCVVTDCARAYFGVLDERLPGALHDVEQYANNVLEADHGRLKARLLPMRGAKTTTRARLVCSGHAFLQNVRRGHYELGVDAPPKRRLAQAFAELALVI